MRRADTLVILLIVVLVWPSVAQAQASETVYYFHTDAIGSVRMITDAAGQEVARYDYLPFGEEWGPTSYSNIPNDRKFAGLQRDAETGFDYALARYYRSQSGRFTQPDDPGYGDPHDAQSMQLYGYARNNPLTYVDPTGHQFAVAICGYCTEEEIEENARKREWIRLQLSTYPWLAAAADPLLGLFLPVTPQEQARAIGAELMTVGTMAVGRATMRGAGFASGITGQQHHGISRTIHKALEQHPILRGVYKARDPRFVTRARDLSSHRGYDSFHRRLDTEISNWIRANPNANQQQFERYLRSVYQRPELLTRFPNGL